MILLRGFWLGMRCSCFDKTILLCYTFAEIMGVRKMASLQQSTRQWQMSTTCLADGRGAAFSGRGFYFTYYFIFTQVNQSPHAGVAAF